MFYWVLSSSLAIAFKLFLIFGQSESRCSYKVWSFRVRKNNVQLITWSFLMIQSVGFTSAAFEVFAEAYLFVLVSASEKNSKN